MYDLLREGDGAATSLALLEASENLGNANVDLRIIQNRLPHCTDVNNRARILCRSRRGATEQSEVEQSRQHRMCVRVRRPTYGEHAGRRVT